MHLDYVEISQNCPRPLNYGSEGGQALCVLRTLALLQYDLVNSYVFFITGELHKISPLLISDGGVWLARTFSRWFSVENQLTVDPHRKLLNKTPVLFSNLYELRNSFAKQNLPKLMTFTEIYGSEGNCPFGTLFDPSHYNLNSAFFLASRLPPFIRVPGISPRITHYFDIMGPASVYSHIPMFELS